MSNVENSSIKSFWGEKWQWKCSGDLHRWRQRADREREKSKLEYSARKGFGNMKNLHWKITEKSRKFRRIQILYYRIRRCIAKGMARSWIHVGGFCRDSVETAERCLASNEQTREYRGRSSKQRDRRWKEWQIVAEEKGSRTLILGSYALLSLSLSLPSSPGGPNPARCVLKRVN